MALGEMESRNIIGKNLFTIMRLNGIKTQKELAEILEVGQAQLCHIIKGEQYPTVYPFLANIQNKFGYTIDEFLYTEIKGGLQEGPTVCSVGYDGVYQVYYMSERNKLYSGVLLIKKPNSVTNVSKAVFLSKLNINYADVCFQNVNEQAQKGGYYGEAEYYMNSQSGAGLIYEGEVSYSTDHMFVNLCSKKDGSKVMMTFYREYSMKLVYPGGLGTMSIVGEGKSKIPSARYIGISRQSLECEESEILPYLEIKDTNTSAKIDTNLIEKIFEQYRTRIQNTEMFSVEEQIRLASAKVEDFIMEELNKRLAKSFLVTPEMHDDWCEFIKTKKYVKRVG
jgi:hypothetical protein